MAFSNQRCHIEFINQGQMPGDQHILIVNSLMTLVDSLTIFERVQNTPIPWAYSIHLKQTVLLYLTSLPFQLIASTGYAAIPIIFVTSFVLLGIEKIGSVSVNEHSAMSECGDVVSRLYSLRG